MKRDRIMGVIICILILGNMQLQQIAGIWRLAAPSLPQILWAVATGKPLGISVCSRPAEAGRQPVGRLGFISAAVHAGWPQLSFVCDQTLLLHRRLSHTLTATYSLKPTTTPTDGR